MYPTRKRRSKSWHGTSHIYGSSPTVESMWKNARKYFFRKAVSFQSFLCSWKRCGEVFWDKKVLVYNLDKTILSENESEIQQKDGRDHIRGQEALKRSTTERKTKTPLTPDSELVEQNSLQKEQHVLLHALGRSEREKTTRMCEKVFTLRHMLEKAVENAGRISSQKTVTTDKTLTKALSTPPRRKHRTSIQANTIRVR